MSEAEWLSGAKVVLVIDQAGATHNVRVEVSMKELAPKILMRYAGTEDPRDLVRPFVPKEFQTDAFLDSLRPGSLAELANVVTGLLLGPKALQRALRGKPIL